jgi:hypothetical protein
MLCASRGLGFNKPFPQFACGTPSDHTRQSGGHPPGLAHRTVGSRSASSATQPMAMICWYARSRGHTQHARRVQASEDRMGSRRGCRRSRRTACTRIRRCGLRLHQRAVGTPTDTSSLTRYRTPVWSIGSFCAAELCLRRSRARNGSQGRRVEQEGVPACGVGSCGTCLDCRDE